MPEYDKSKVRKAMLIAPLAGAVGVLPFLFYLNLSAGQWLFVIVAVVILSYILAGIFGGLGYLVLKRLGYTENKYLLSYAVALVALVAIAYADFYALVSLGPPVLLATWAFCYLRGEPTG